MHNLHYNTRNKNMDRTLESAVGSSDHLTQFTHQKICKENQNEWIDMTGDRRKEQTVKSFITKYQGGNTNI
jgi:hypothetical protein